MPLATGPPRPGFSVGIGGCDAAAVSCCKAACMNGIER